MRWIWAIYSRKSSGSNGKDGHRIQKNNEKLEPFNKELVILSKIDYKIITGTKDKERHYIMMKQ